MFNEEKGCMGKGKYMAESIVKVENLVKRYKEILALDHLNLDIKEGEIFGLLGPNGSGKTTTIYSILGLLKYDKGTIEVFGKAINSDATETKNQIGVVMQNVAVFEELNVYENIDYFCGLYIQDKKKRRTYVEEAIAFVGLEEYKKMRPAKLSGGLIRRLNIACGIAHKPRLIFMDEPTVAVDPQSRNKILEGIQELNRQGATIVYTSHYMEEVEQICSRIAIMDHGKMLAIGTKETLKKMIKMGETITVENIKLEEEDIYHIKELEDVYQVSYENHIVVVKFTKSNQSLVKLLTYFHHNKIVFGQVSTQLPTLNDVFLEITGKALRD